MEQSKEELIRKRLEKISAMNGGRLTPDAVLQDAKSEKSPLHDQFTWDDSEAAIQWRLQQARELIRSIRIEIQVDQRVVSTVRYVRDPSAGKAQGYVEVAKLRNERELAREALAHEIRAVNALIERSRSLADALGLSSEFNLVEESVHVLHASLEKAA